MTHFIGHSTYFFACSIITMFVSTGGFRMFERYSPFVLQHPVGFSHEITEELYLFDVES